MSFSIIRFRFKIFHWIPVIILLCCSCRQKSYDELLQENRELKQLISEREREIEENYARKQIEIRQGILDSIENNLYNNFYDSIYRVWSGIIPHNENKFAQIHKKYTNKGALSFIEPINFDKVVYTFPTKDFNKRYKDTVQTDEKNSSFIPRESGLYHWSAELKIHNERTGQLRTYQIIDSIYIVGIIW